MANKFNVNFGAIVNGRMVYAPVSFTEGDKRIFNPKPETYLNYGWQPVIKTEKPVLEENQYAKYTFEQQEGSIVQVWTVYTKPTKITISDRIDNLESLQAQTDEMFIELYEMMIGG